MIAELNPITNPTFRERVERMFIKKALQLKLAVGGGIVPLMKKWAKEKHKQFLRPRNLLKVKVFGKDHIWSAHLIHMPVGQEGPRYCLTVIDLYTRYAK